MVVGTLASGEQILIERPLVRDADETNDAHWATLEQDDDPAVLRPGNDGYPIPVGVIVRINKPITTNAVGVSWS